MDQPLPLGGGETVVRPSGPGPTRAPLDAPGGPAESFRAAEREPAESFRAAGPESEPDAEDLRLRDLVAFMARGLVDSPDDVKVEILNAGEDASFELQVHPDDLGHVIGKQGRTARSLRHALGASAERVGRRANLDIAD